MAMAFSLLENMVKDLTNIMSAGWLAGTEIGITPLGAEHTAPATHKDYFDWPRTLL